jgi:hypothetical protein
MGIQTAWSKDRVFAGQDPCCSISATVKSQGCEDVGIEDRMGESIGSGSKIGKEKRRELDVEMSQIQNVWVCVAIVPVNWRIPWPIFVAKRHH